ncbi:hypothetical protein [Gilvimarinus chinensis]|uniref:hypothetical protein n=1 Tax=Gilvimarinus chinensis TaxID=396005 RepID=UPI00036E2418|nr:hypothetical protein [Gilvimarinus chinensis]
MLKKLREDFRLAMATLLSGCAVLAIGPFAIIRALKGDWVIAGLDAVITLGVASMFRYHLIYGRSEASSIIAASFYSLAGLGMSYLNPQPMIYWMYPIILANFFLLNLRAAIIINVVLFFMLLPLASHFPEQMEFFDLMVSIALVAAFAGIFAWKTDDQHQLLDNWAHMDALTGVGNRRKFFATLNKKRSSHQALLFLWI